MIQNILQKNWAYVIGSKMTNLNYKKKSSFSDCVKRWPLMECILYLLLWWKLKTLRMSHCHLFQKKNFVNWKIWQITYAKWLQFVFVFLKKALTGLKRLQKMAVLQKRNLIMPILWLLCCSWSSNTSGIVKFGYSKLLFTFRCSKIGKKKRKMKSTLVRISNQFALT